MDDCSTDDSWTILEEYTTHPKVRAILRGEKNSGNTFVQWCKGIAMAKGEYIWMAESDDVADPTLLSTLVGKLEEDKEITCSFCQSKWIDEQGSAIKSTVYKHWKEDWVMDGGQFIERYLLGYNYICNASAVVMRRSAALNVSDRCMQYKASGDRQFWIEIAQMGKVSYVHATLNAFRQHAKKVSNRAAMTGQNILEDLSIYTWYRQHHRLSVSRRLKTLLYHLRASRSKDVQQVYRAKIQKEWLRQW